MKYRLPAKSLIAGLFALVIFSTCQTTPGGLFTPRLIKERVAGWDLQVWLPEGYGDSDQTYPVAYVFDGTNLFDRVPGSSRELWRLHTTADRLTREGLLKPLILVGINLRFPSLEVITTKIIPYIDGKYRTETRPEGRAIMGSSGGASYSFLAALSRPDLFSTAGALSLPCFSGLFEFAHTVKKVPVTLWLDNGTEEPGRGYFALGTRTLVDQLRAKGWNYGEDLFYYEDPGARHTESVWARRVENPLLLFQGTGSRKPVSTTSRQQVLQAWGPIRVSADTVLTEGGVRYTAFPSQNGWAQWVLGGLDTLLEGAKDSTLRIPVVQGSQEMSWKTFTPAQAGRQLANQGWLAWEWYHKRSPVPLTSQVREEVVQALRIRLPGIEIPPSLQALSDPREFYTALTKLLEIQGQGARILTFGGFYPLEDQIRHLAPLAPQVDLKVPLPEGFLWPTGLSTTKDRSRSPFRNGQIEELRGAVAALGRLYLLPDLSLLLVATNKAVEEGLRD